MSIIEDLYKEVEKLEELVEHGGILREFLPEEYWDASLQRFADIKASLVDKRDQLQAEIEREKTRFRQEAQSLFQEKLANREDMPRSYSTVPQFYAIPRLSREVPYSVTEIHSIFQESGLNPPPVKITIDTAKLDKEQKKVWKTLERVVGVSCIVKESNTTESED
jgi:hypothetical protein